MLNGITWGQFLVFLMVAACAYYLYVVLVYYKAEAHMWMTRIGGTKQGPGGGKNNNNNESSVEPEPKATGSQAAPSGKEQPNAGSGGDGQFQAMQRAITVMRQVIAQGIENKLDRENLLDHIKEVLGSYRQLRGTEYAETINNFLIRVCSSELFLELGESELGELWK